MCYSDSDEAYCIHVTLVNWPHVTYYLLPWVRLLIINNDNEKKYNKGLNILHIMFAISSFSYNILSALS